MDISVGRDIALIWLSLFCAVGLLVPIGLLYFAIRGINFAQTKSVELLQMGQTQAKRIHHETERISDRAIQPVLSAQSRVAQAKATVKRITRPSGFRKKDNAA